MTGAGSRFPPPTRGWTRGDALLVDLIRGLPYALGGPQAVLIEQDQMSPGAYLRKLIFALAHESRLYKVVVHLDYLVTRPGKDGPRDKHSRNVIVTASPTSAGDLGNAGTYRLIKGGV